MSTGDRSLKDINALERLYEEWGEHLQDFQRYHAESLRVALAMYPNFYSADMLLA